LGAQEVAEAQAGGLAALGGGGGLAAVGSVVSARSVIVPLTVMLRARRAVTWSRFPLAATAAPMPARPAVVVPLAVVVMLVTSLA
jgi:hypothetical protein